MSNSDRPTENLATQPDAHRLRVRVRSIIYQADWINAYEVVDPDGNDLPRFTAGSHIDVFFRDGRVRQYSLCNDPMERSRYMFAVQREPDGRGGSKAIFNRVHVGRILMISQPRNNFPLHDEASFHLLLAGGIGITPVMAMTYQLRRTGAAFQLHYCTRSPERTAFKSELASLAADHEKVRFYYDGGVSANGLNIERLLAAYRPGTHLYACGPAGFISAVRAGAAHWPKSNVHFELFTTLSAETSNREANASTLGRTGFRIKLANSGAMFDIPDDKSIVQVLREHGINVATSCENGLCGTCRTRYLEGEPEHRDYLLDDHERSEYVLICCARSRSPLLVLDL